MNRVGHLATLSPGQAKMKLSYKFWYMTAKEDRHAHQGRSFILSFLDVPIGRKPDIKTGNGLYMNSPHYRSTLTYKDNLTWRLRPKKAGPFLVTRNHSDILVVEEGSLLSKLSTSRLTIAKRHCRITLLRWTVSYWTPRPVVSRKSGRIKFQSKFSFLSTKLEGQNKLSDWFTGALQFIFLRALSIPSFISKTAISICVG